MARGPHQLDQQLFGQIQQNGDDDGCDDDDDDEAINDGGDDIDDCFQKIFGEMQQHGDGFQRFTNENIIRLSRQKK